MGGCGRGRKGGAGGGGAAAEEEGGSATWRRLDRRRRFGRNWKNGDGGGNTAAEERERERRIERGKEGRKANREDGAMRERRKREWKDAGDERDRVGLCRREDQGSELVDFASDAADYDYDDDDDDD